MDSPVLGAKTVLVPTPEPPDLPMPPQLKLFNNHFGLLLSEQKNTKRFLIVFNN